MDQQRARMWIKSKKAIHVSHAGNTEEIDGCSDEAPAVTRAQSAIVAREVAQQPALFDLPEQRAPDVLYADRHALYPCSRCGATGVEANRIPSWVPYRDVLWDPKCRGCDGAGRILKYVGLCTDV